MKIHTFKVVGLRPFPMDMLRYDACWPNNDEAVGHIINLLLDSGPDLPTAITLSSWKEPTVLRWHSFGWQVGEIK